MTYYCSGWSQLKCITAQIFTTSNKQYNAEIDTNNAGKYYNEINEDTHTQQSPNVLFCVVVSHSHQQIITIPQNLSHTRDLTMCKNDAPISHKLQAIMDHDKIVFIFR